MKIVVVGLGYVGLANAVLLAQQNEVIGVDRCQRKVDLVNSRKAPISDRELEDFLQKKNLKLKATKHLSEVVSDANFVVIATPTDYNEDTNFFDTSSVEEIIEQTLSENQRVCIVIKSTIPVGFIDKVRTNFNYGNIIFCPEFLREGKALFDILNPNRIILGDRTKDARLFSQLLLAGAKKKKVP